MNLTTSNERIERTTMATNVQAKIRKTSRFVLYFSDSYVRQQPSCMNIFNAAFKEILIQNFTFFALFPKGFNTSPNKVEGL